MHRIQIQLTPTQERRLRELARLRGTSISALIREGVDHLLVPETESSDRRWERAQETIGRYRSGGSDVSAKHDEYFAEAAAERKKRP